MFFYFQGLLGKVTGYIVPSWLSGWWGQKAESKVVMVFVESQI